MLTQHYSSFLVIFWRDCTFTVLQLLSLTKWLFIQISIIHALKYFISSCWQEKGRVLANGWTHPSPMTIFIRSVIRKRYHSDIQYHTTLNTILSVAVTFVFRAPQMSCWLLPGCCGLMSHRTQKEINAWNKSQSVASWVRVIANAGFIIIFINLGFFGRFETVTNIRTWIKSHRCWRML